MEAKKSVYISVAQKKHLVELMKGKENLISGKFTNSFTRKDGQKQWEGIADVLNAIPGAKKEWHQWRKSWQDLRVKAKQKQAALRRHALATGGGPAMTDDITPVEEDVISTIAPVTIEGHEIEESVVDFDFDFSTNVVENNSLSIQFETPIQSDHDYTSIMQSEPGTSSSKPSNAIKFDSWTPKKKAKNVESTNTDKLVALSEKKLEIKAAYYKEKLALLKQNNEIKENINKTLNRIQLLLEKKLKQ
ncbi:hypothetical protein FQR65_LT19206 [Abscondita terminalis]|nr:hypothetical protein FQR65_LT19206 [Abscondita terminalis]